jgi:hypothetical protein
MSVNNLETSVSNIEMDPRLAVSLFESESQDFARVCASFAIPLFFVFHLGIGFIGVFTVQGSHSVGLGRSRARSRLPAF